MMVWTLCLAFGCASLVEALGQKECVSAIVKDNGFLQHIHVHGHNQIN